MSGGMLSPTFGSVSTAIALVDGQTVAGIGPGWQARLLVRTTNAPTTMTAQYIARGQTLSSVLALINATWPGNVDADVYLEQTTEIQSASDALASLGTDAKYLAAGVVVSRGSGDDPTHFATCTVALELYDDATGIVMAASAPFDWTQAAIGQVVPLKAAEYQADPTQWPVLQRRWRVHWAFTITDSGAPSLVAFHGEPQFELSDDGTLPEYDPTFDDSPSSVVVVAASLTADVNDYNPTNLASAEILVITPDIDGHTITGLAGGYDGRRLTIVNGASGATGFILGANSLASSSGNRFGGNSVYLTGQAAVDLVYDATYLQWHILTGVWGSAAGDYAIPSGASLPTLYVQSASGSFAFKGDITPTQLSANTDNWDPTGNSGSAVWRVSADASRNLTGIASGSDGRVLILCNVGSFDLVLKHDVTSTAANRFYCANSTDFTLKTNQTVVLVYDATSSRWRVGNAVSGSLLDVQTFTATGTWTKPTGFTPKWARVLCLGTGGSGGAGRKGAASSTRSGGGGGGGGGLSVAEFATADLSATHAVVVGSAPAGAASQTTNTTDGVAGTAGADTTFGGTLVVGGGGGGGAGSASGGAGTAGAGIFAGGAGGSGASNTAGAAGSGGAPGGGGGGSITLADAEVTGGNGGVPAGSGATAPAGGPAGTATAGGSGSAPNSASSSPTPGTGGGGGGGKKTATVAGAGGPGALGSGGGGGGAGLNATSNSGAGGAGGRGICVVVTWG